VCLVARRLLEEAHARRAYERHKPAPIQSLKQRRAKGFFDGLFGDSRLDKKHNFGLSPFGGACYHAARRTSNDKKYACAVA
jgi:hypothetical protein